MVETPWNDEIGGITLHRFGQTLGKMAAGEFDALVRQIAAGAAVGMAIWCFSVCAF